MSACEPDRLVLSRAV